MLATVYRPPSVDEQPDVTLEQWRVLELPNGDRHFVGKIVGGAHDGRVSSKIKEWDSERLVGVTRSGRRYKLDGDAGTNMDALYVWSVWCHRYGVEAKACKDVSAEYAQ